jgi:hypothetical protein
MEPTDHELLVALHEDFAVFKEKIIPVCKNVEKHEVLLNGNGQPGLKDTLTTVKTKVGVLIWGMTVVATAAITGAVGTVWQLMTK